MFAQLISTAAILIENVSILANDKNFRNTNTRYRYVILVPQRGRAGYYKLIFSLKNTEVYLVTNVNADIEISTDMKYEV